MLDRNFTDTDIVSVPVKTTSVKYPLPQPNRDVCIIVSLHKLKVHGTASAVPLSMDFSFTGIWVTGSLKTDFPSSLPPFVHV